VDVVLEVHGQFKTPAALEAYFQPAGPEWWIVACPGCRGLIAEREALNVGVGINQPALPTPAATPGHDRGLPAPPTDLAARMSLII